MISTFKTINSKTRHNFLRSESKYLGDLNSDLFRNENTSTQFWIQHFKIGIFSNSGTNDMIDGFLLKSSIQPYNSFLWKNKSSIH